MSRVWLTSISCMLAAGCQRPSPPPAETASGDSVGGTTTYDIQRGYVQEGATVTLSSVVATSGLSLDGKGFFAEDPEGGAYSGVFVYLQGDFANLEIAAGDRLDLTGQVNEFNGFTEVIVTSTKDISVTGTGSVSPEDLGDGRDVTDWEPWEGVLVQLDDQLTTGCPNRHNETPLSAGISMFARLYAYDTTLNASYTAVVGPIEYAFGSYGIDPRSADDLRGAMAGDPCPGDAVKATVAEVQQGSIPAGDLVTLSRVVATTEAHDDGFWVQDAGGGEWSGIYVTGPGAGSVQLGDVLDVTGRVVEYYGRTEIEVSEAGDITTTGSALPVALTLDVVPDDWEPDEGVLVTLLEVTITGELDPSGTASTNWNIDLDTALYDWTADAGSQDTLSSLTGVVDYSYDTWRIYPRSADDVATTGGS